MAMIVDLDQSLSMWLLDALKPAIHEEFVVTFQPPDQLPDSPKVPAIDLFLYDVKQNLDQRSNEWIVERQPDGKATQKRAPVQVTCAYLISAWPAAGEDPVEQEHLMLGEVLKLLLANPKIPAKFLQGSLRGLDTAIAATAVQPGAQNVTDLWRAFGGKAKAALNYSVNVGVEVGQPQDSYLVTRKTIKFELVEGVESD
ncbi:conserved hypothetical protein [Candidatus Sulfopaludibacter sp. SbA3]|nr:conserved hypothetical protein [Candidatus Sulfopaludibacter sp. SbA3]